MRRFVIPAIAAAIVLGLVALSVHSLDDLINLIGEIATIPAAFAGLFMLVVLLPLLAHLIPVIPGPPRSLRVKPLFIDWPSDPPSSSRHISWRHNLPFMAFLTAVAAPGALWFLAQPNEDHLNLRLAWIVCELVGGLVLAFLSAAWIEWLVRLAAMKNRVGFALLVPAVPLAIYAVLCRVFGPPAVDHALLGAVGWVVILAVLALVCFVLFWIGVYIQWLPLVGIWLLLKSVSPGLTRAGRYVRSMF